MDPKIEEKTVYQFIKSFESLVIVGAIVFFGKQGIRYHKVYGTQRDNYIMATFICLGLSQLLFAINDAKSGFLYMAMTYAPKGVKWA